jgi:hypothetical protein
MAEKMVAVLAGEMVGWKAVVMAEPKDTQKAVK